MPDVTVACQTEETPPVPPAAAPAGALGKRVGLGMLFMVISALSGRGLALVAQAVLAYLLTKSDFGIFAIATSASSIAQLFRDGGLRFLLVQRGVKEYEAIEGPVFWMSMAFNLATTAVLVAMAPILAHIYEAPQLVTILALIALTVPIGTVQMMCDTRLRIDLRFATLARIGMVSALIRVVVTVAAAWKGAGPLSMAYGVVAVTVFETVATYIAAPVRSWRRPAQVATWPGLFRQGKWTIMQMLAISTMYFGAYASIGLFVDPDTVGIYSFAFSIITVTGHLLALQFDIVLVPSLARLQDDPPRRRAALLRALHAMAATCIPLCLFIGVIYAPVEQLVWRGLWEVSTPCVWIMSITYPLFTLHVMARSSLTAAGQFRRAALLMLVIGIGVMLSAGLAAWAGRTATWIAAGSGGYSAAAGLWMLHRGLKPQGVRTGEMIGAVVPITILLTPAAAAVVWADHALLAGVDPLVRLIVVGTVGAAVIGVLVRAVFASFLRDLVAIAPARLAAPARRLLLLGDAPGPAEPASAPA